MYSSRSKHILLPPPLLGASQWCRCPVSKPLHDHGILRRVEGGVSQQPLPSQQIFQPPEANPPPPRSSLRKAPPLLPPSAVPGLVGRAHRAASNVMIYRLPFTVRRRADIVLSPSPQCSPQCSWPPFFCFGISPLFLVVIHHSFFLVVTRHSTFAPLIFWTWCSFWGRQNAIFSTPSFHDKKLRPKLPSKR